MLGKEIELTSERLGGVKSLFKTRDWIFAEGASGYLTMPAEQVRRD
jgi:hypothetical protein